MEIEEFNKLMNRTITLSNVKMKKFMYGMYPNVNKTRFARIWQLPIISSSNLESLITTELSTKTKEELLDILMYHVENQLYSEKTDEEERAVYIRMSDLEQYLSPQECDEYRQLVKSGKVQATPSSIIVYNEPELMEEFEDLIEANAERGNKKTQEELENIFLEQISQVITHERCHFNAERTTPSGEVINGCMLTMNELDKILDAPLSKMNDFVESRTNINLSLSPKIPMHFKSWADKNEILIDTLTLMIHSYERGLSPEDTLFKVIKSRNDLGEYIGIDDKQILSLFVLFPKELTDWAMFCSTSSKQRNLVKDKFEAIYGLDDIDPTLSSMRPAVQAYCERHFDELSKTQKTMLGMLGLVRTQSIRKPTYQSFSESPKTFAEISNTDLLHNIGSIQSIMDMFAAREEEKTIDD